MSLPIQPNSVVGTRLLDLLSTRATSNEVATFGFSNTYGVQIRMYDTNTPATGGILYYNSSNSVFTLGRDYANSVNVGINTTRANAALHVIGDVNVSGTFSTCNLTVTGSSTYNASYTGVVNTLALYQPTSANYKNIITNDSIPQNRILFTTTLTAGKYLISLNIPYTNLDPFYSIGTTYATLGMYLTTPTNFNSSLLPSQSYTIPVSSLTTQTAIDPSFYIEVVADTAIVLAVSGQGQQIQFTGSANVITLSGITISSLATSVKQPLQIAPIRRTYILPSPTSQLSLTSSGFYRVTQSSNIEIYRNGYKLAYISPTSNDFTYSYYNNGYDTSTTFTINLTTPFSINDVVDVSIWPETIGNVSLQSGYVYQTITNPWSNILNLNVNSTTQFVGIGTYNSPQQLTVIGQSYFSSNMGIGTAIPNAALDVLSRGQVTPNVVSTFQGGLVQNVMVQQYYEYTYTSITYNLMTTDLFNNIYITGYYASPTNMALSNLNGTTTTRFLYPTTYDSGSVLYTNSSFIIQYSSNGIIQKVSPIISTDVSTNTQGVTCTTDTLGNLYTGGYYNSVTTVSLCNLDNSYSSYSLPKPLLTNSINAYIVKYSSNGIIQQNSTIRARNTSYINSMTTDTTNNLYIVGNYTSSTIVSLSNLNGTYSSYTLPIRNPLSVGKTTFLIKYSSSGLIQGRTTLNISGNTTYETDGNFVITDTSGNLYLTGYYSSSATVALTNLDGTSSSYTLPTLGITRKYYLIKYSTDGLVRGVTYISALSVGQSMTVNNSGNIIVLANYTPTGVLVPLYNLDGTQSSYSLSGFILSAIYVPFIVQYSPSGIVTLGTDLGFYGTAITSTIDNNGILVISGILTDTTVQYVKNLDGTLSSYTIYDNGSYNSFTIVYSPSGKVQGVSIQRASSIRINQSLVSSSGNIYILGYYTSSTNVPLSNLDGTASSSNLPITLSFNYPYVIQYSPTSLPTTTSYVRTLPNTLSVQQTPTGQEFPPVGISNIYFAPDYTDTIASIDIGQSLSNLEYPPSAMNNYDTTLFSTYGAGTYTASASSQYDSTNYLAWKLFTKLNANVSNWTSYSGSYSSGNYVSTGTTITYDISGNRYRGEWVQIQLPISIQLQVYQLSVFSTSANSNPYTWYIFGSIDGINWILINTQTAISWTASAIRNFTVQTNTYYSYYRMVISQVDGATPYCVINQWRLFTNSILGQNRYPKYKATIPYYTSTNSYGLGQYQIWANTIQDYSFSNQAVPTGLFTKTVGSTSNTVWASYSNVYTSTVDALSSNLPIIYAQFPDLIQLNSYSITARGGNALETPSKWTLFGSNTTITSAWQTVDVESNITNWSAFQTSNFSVSGSNTYNFYKLELYRNSSPVPTRMSMGELRFYGSKPESRLTVSSAGFVGIGTTMAQTALINGDIFIEGVLGNSILNSGPNLNFDGSSNSKNTFLSWLQYVTSTEYRFALQPRTFQTCWWATNFGTPTQYNGYTYSTVSGPPGNYAHRGGVLLLDGRVLLNQWVYTSIGIFTPYTNTYSTPITGIPAYSYFGGVLLPDGRVVLVPFDATNIGIFNPNTNIFTTIAGAPGGNAYIGGVLLPDGRVLFVPYSATTIGFFNPTTNTYSTILRGSGTGSYFGGVLLPDGRVIFVPLQATYVGIFNSITNTYTTILGAPGSSAYAGGVLVPDGRVIFTPSSATTIGIFNPTTNSYTSILGAPGSVAYEGGVLLPDGRVFFIPNNSATFGFFNPLTNTYTTQSGAPGSGAFSGGILLPDGRVILCPYNSTNFLGIMTPTQLSRPPPLELCYHPCFNKF